MERSEAIRCFNEGKHFVETCLEDITSLKLNNDKELRQVLRGTVMVEVSYKAAENFGKVGSYIIDGKDGAQTLKDELFGLKVKVVQLYADADRHNLVTIKKISETIISEIKEVEKWTGENRINDYPDIPDELKNLFPNESQCIDFVRRNYGKAAEFVAHAYLDEHGVIDPSDTNKSIPVVTILFRYFVKPFIKGEKEKESARTGFYKYFKIK